MVTAPSTQLLIVHPLLVFTRQSLLVGALVIAGADQLTAQCALQALPGTGMPGAWGLAGSGLWDPDGTGPGLPQLVVGGFETVFGNVQSERLAAWNGTWASIGAGAVGLQGPTGMTFVWCFASMPNGDLVVGGAFTSANGQLANNIARWNGTAWSPLGTGVTLNGNVAVAALAVMPNGDLIAGGQFATAGGAPANCIARWNGSAWSPLGTGLSGFVHALVVMPNGDLVAGGDFGSAGGAPAFNVARWNGVAWSAMGFTPTASPYSPTVRALAVLPSGELAVGGNFITTGGTTVNSIARWNGTAWSGLGGGVLGSHGFVDSLALLSNGDLAVGGRFTTAGGVAANNVARWDGTTWSAIGVGAGFQVSSLTTLPTGDLVAIGDFPAPVVGVARWDGSAWQPLSIGTDGSVSASAKLANGDVLAGGDFTSIDGVAANHVARWNGTAWSPLGAGMPGRVSAVIELGNGTLFAGGNFAATAGPSYVARWSGTSWVNIGYTFAPIRAFAELPNGDLVMGGDFFSVGGVTASGAARWNGSGWSAMGISGAISALAVRPNGELFAVSTYVHRWTGTAWAVISFTAAHSLAIDRDGSLLAGFADGVQRWNGATWTSLGPAANGAVRSITVLPNGHLLAGGDFTTIGGVAATRLARWNGSAWSPVGTGTDFAATTLLTLADGSAFAGGDFRVVDGRVSAFHARLASTCPASATTFGTSCASLGGPMQLSARGLPWAGGTFSAQCTGMAPNALGLVVIGLTVPNLQLDTIFPAGGQGCLLLASPDVVSTLVPSAGIVDYAWTLPGNPALAGLQFYSQVAQLQLDAQLNVIALTSSNALQMVVGTY